MVSSVLLYQRLQKLIGSSMELAIVGLAILVHGDPYQLLPVKGASIYFCNTVNMKGIFSFRTVERF